MAESIISFRTKEDTYQDECHEDAIRTLRRVLKETKEKQDGRVIGICIVGVHEDRSTFSATSMNNANVTLIGALTSVATRLVQQPIPGDTELTDDDE